MDGVYITHVHTSPSFCTLIGCRQLTKPLPHLSLHCVRAPGVSCYPVLYSVYYNTYQDPPQ